MINVNYEGPPHDFDEKVRIPGLNFLLTVPNPTTADYKKHNYWARIKKDLHGAYSSVCAYTCHYIPHDTGSDTVEHFVPKSQVPNLAYDWDNYRLVCGRLNGRKGNHTDVLDPFDIIDGMFVLDFPSLLVTPSSDLDAAVTQGVWKSIERLKLNHDETCVSARLEYVRCYVEGEITVVHLEKYAPFIAKEITRQGLQNSICDIMATG